MPPTLSLTQKRWIVRSDVPPQRTAHDLIAFLMRERGIRPDPSPLTNPSVFPDMERALERIWHAIDHHERIGIFGDYDCDGVTATALLVRLLRRQGIEPLVRLPHRKQDGYGLNHSIVDELCDGGVQLLITVDTGIASVEEIARAQERGVDVIVTDHHHPQAEVPCAHAILHPTLAPAFPTPHPSGAGVALSLVRALEGDRWDDMETDIALAAIGTVADLVELKGDNRTLVQSGLSCLRNLTAGPLTLLVANSVADAQMLTSTDIAFRIAPRINAAGRMADPSLALTALLEGGDALLELEKLNIYRQKETKVLHGEALDALGLDPSSTFRCDLPILCAASATYPPGIIGLIAGKLTEAFGKPSLVANIDKETCTASLRSPPVYHITEGLTRCQNLLTRFGGHAQAAGCTFPLQSLPELQERLSEDIREHTNADDLLPAIAVDAMIQSCDITLDFCEALSRLEPFGMGNPEPRFLLENIHLEHTRCVGSDESHLQGRIAGMKAIGFRLGNCISHAAEPLDIVCYLGIDTWQGRREPQIVVEDMRVAVSEEVRITSKK